MNAKFILAIGLALLFLKRKQAKDLYLDLTQGEDMQITSNFTWREFQGRTGFRPDEVSARTLQMVGSLAGLLEVIRHVAGVPIAITSGMRTAQTAAQIASEGANPSATSDHFYDLNPASPLSVGAVDIQSSKMDTKTLFNIILKLKYEGKIRTGQILLETANNGASYWVHLANDPRLFLTPAQLAKRSSSSMNLIAVSMDNGKTFTPVPDGKFVA
jgi:hypothetical protein